MHIVSAACAWHGQAPRWHKRSIALNPATVRPLPQDFNVRKFFERGFKSVVHSSRAISVAPPGLYAERFVSFMHEVGGRFMRGKVVPESILASGL